MIQLKAKLQLKHFHENYFVKLQIYKISILLVVMQVFSGLIIFRIHGQENHAKYFYAKLLFKKFLL